MPLYFLQGIYEDFTEDHRKRDRRYGLGPTLGIGRSHTDIIREVAHNKKFLSLIAALFESKLKLTHNFPARQIGNAVTLPALSHSRTLSRTSERQ